MPLASQLLRQICPCCLSPTPSHYELLWAMATTCFFGFFRVGEITAPSSSDFDPAIHLAWGDVAISEVRRMVQVFLKRSKTDQFGRGTEVFLGATVDELCPVRAVSSYVAHLGTAAGAFFRTAAGIAVMKARFVEQVRAVLSRTGIPIQALGRWSSPAFLRYIRTPREQLARFSNSLAHRN